MRCTYAVISLARQPLPSALRYYAITEGRAGQTGLVLLARPSLLLRASGVYH